MKRWHLLIAVFILIVSIAYLYNRLQDVKKESESRSQIILEKNSEIKTWKDSAGKWRAEKIAAQVDKKSLQKALDSVKSLPPEVQTYTEVITETKDSIITQPPDTIHRHGKPYFASFNFQTKWIDLKGYPYNGGLGINYTVYDSLGFNTSWRDVEGSNNKQLYIEGISHNPNTRIRGLRNFSVAEVEQDNDIFVVSLGTGFGIDNKFRPNWNLIELHFGVKLTSF